MNRTLVNYLVSLLFIQNAALRLAWILLVKGIIKHAKIKTIL